MSRRVPEAGQVWGHRHPCRACYVQGVGYGTHRVEVAEVKGEVVFVRDLALVGDRTIGTPYPTRLARFGSLEKGGLRLLGRRGARGEIVPVKRLDMRVIDHPRVPPRVRTFTTVPSEAAA